MVVTSGIAPQGHAVKAALFRCENLAAGSGAPFRAEHATCSLG
ncbi:hypothetical protein [Pelotomaculum sp. FP]|nr:hypothetical protein [Pelotomaculum sp. FP]